MSHVVIEKVNEVHLKVVGSMDIEQEIKDHFTFKAPGYKFHPKYKARVWDGNMSLFNMQTNRIPAGHIVRLLDFLKQEDVDVEFKENELHGLPTAIDDTITREEVKEFCIGLEPWSWKENDGQGGVFEIHEYQIDAIYESLRNRRLTLISPTSSGKSLILYCIIRWLMAKDETFRSILCVPNIGLVTQMFSDFDEYSHKNGWRIEDYAQKLFTGQSKELTKQILITTWQSLKGVVPKKGDSSRVLNTYDGVFVDEAHTAKGKELQTLLEAMTMIPYRIGTTGTTADPVNQLLIEGMLGPLYRVITTRELMDDGKVSQMKIFAVVMHYSDEERKLVSQKTKKKERFDYPQEIEFITAHEKRNRAVRNLALACTGTTLVLFNKIEHGKALLEAIKAKTDLPVYYVDGDVDGTKREAIRKTANKEDCIIVASYGTFSTGINIPRISNVIFASPSKSSIRILQSIGRGLRLHSEKSRLNLFDLVDDIKYLKNKNFALQHFEERLKIYQKEQFEIAIKELQL